MQANAHDWHQPHGFNTTYIIDDADMVELAWRHGRTHAVERIGMNAGA